MQPVSLNLATFDPRYLPPLLARPRLLDLLQRQPATSTIMIQGQAAQGKTALVADYLLRNNSQVVWLTLESRHSHAEAFYPLLYKALGRAIQGVGGHGASRNKKSDADTWQNRIDRFWAEMPEGFEIVVDGLEQLDDTASAHGPVGELCRQCEGRNRVWLLSRRTATFKHLGDCAGRHAMTLDNSDLAFTPDETDRYFKDFLGKPQSSAWIDNIYRITDGWCGGLVLVSQAIEKTGENLDTDRAGQPLLSHIASGSDKFFKTEIFDKLTPSLIKRLLLLSLADIIDCDLIGRLADWGDCQASIEDLSRNLGFIHATLDGTGNRMVFRLNRLFRDFLRSKFKAELSSAEQRSIYNNFGLLYDKHGDLLSAAKFWLRSADFDSAAKAIKKIGVDLVIKGELDALERWLDQMPKVRVQSDPWLYLLLTLARRIKGQARSVADFKDVWKQFCTRKDDRGRMITAAFLIEALVFQGKQAETCLVWIRRGEQLLAEHGEEPYYAWAKLLLWMQIGFGAIMRGPDLARGLSAARNAMLLAHKMDDKALIAQATIIHGLGLIAGGQYKQAKKDLDRLEPSTDGSALLMYEVLRQLGSAEIALRQGDFVFAGKELDSARKHIESNSLVFLYPQYVETTGYLQLGGRQYDDARKTCRHLLDVSVLAGNPFFRAAAYRLSASIYYHRQQHAQAFDETCRALEILDKHGPDTLQAMRVRQLQATVLIHLDKAGPALKLLNQALAYFKAGDNAQAMAETQLILALLEICHGAPQTARSLLQEGSTLYGEDLFNLFMVLNTVDQKRLRALAKGETAGECRDRPAVAMDLHANSNGPETSTGIVSAGSWSSKAMPGWLDIRTFGGFVVLREGKTPITDGQWSGSKPKLLLKALLVHGLREVPKDIIIDNLWPESNPQAALQNFKVTLHRLRKVLSPAHEQERRHAFIQLKDNLLSLNNARIRVDLEEFLISCKEIKRHALDGDSDRIASLGNGLMELYTGDFLPEEPYAPWVEMKRRALRDTFINTMLQVAAVHRQQERLDSAVKCCHAVLQIDPFQERAIQELLSLYLSLGRHYDARKVLEQYRATLKQEFGVEPDIKTLQIVENFKHKSKKAP